MPKVIEANKISLSPEAGKRVRKVLGISNIITIVSAFANSNHPNSSPDIHREQIEILFSNLCNLGANPDGEKNE